MSIGRKVGRHEGGKRIRIKANGQMKYNADIKREFVNGIKEGHTAIEMCGVLGISRDTYNAWMRKYPDFKFAVHRARNK